MRQNRVRNACLVCLAAAPVGIAGAVPIDLKDAQGRVIHFDAADAATAAPLAQTISGLVHGNEVSTVLIRVLPEAAVTAECGAGSAGCYEASSTGSSTITVPAGPNGARVLTHEYGHHIERSRRTRFTAYLSGVPQWSQARGVPGLLSARSLALDYSLGWDRSALEIFAEDYVQLHNSGTWRISSIAAPSPAIVDALRRDLTTGQPASAPAPATPPAPKPTPSVPATPDTPGANPPVRRAPESLGPGELRGRGKLRPGRRASFPFRLSVPGRSLVVGVRLAGRAKTPARADVVCDGRRIASQTGRVGRPISFRVGNQGPADCQLILTGSNRTLGFRLLLRQQGPAA